MPKPRNIVLPASIMAAYKAALAKSLASPPAPLPPPAPTFTPPPPCQRPPLVNCQSCGETLTDCECAPEDKTPEHPLLNRWAIKGCKLVGQSRWFVSLPAPFFLIIRQCGEPMTFTRHIIEVYIAPTTPPPWSVVYDITSTDIAFKTTPSPSPRPTPPFAKLFSTPFLFHAEIEARKAITLALADIAELPEANVNL